MRHVATLPLLALTLLLPAVSAQARWAETDVPQTFWVEIGGFRVSAETTLRLSGGGEPGDQVNFEAGPERPRRDDAGLHRGLLATRAPSPDEPELDARQAQR